jgi:hypothetical protein
MGSGGSESTDDAIRILRLDGRWIVQYVDGTGEEFETSDAAYAAAQDAATRQGRYVIIETAPPRPPTPGSA